MTIECCKIGCHKPAEFVVYCDLCYYDDTHACEEHLGELMGCTDLTRKPEDMSWRILPIEVLVAA